MSESAPPDAEGPAEASTEHQLSGLDATFLSLETDTSPMQIGGVSILDAKDTGFDLDALKSLLASRLSVSRTLTQRLHETPLNLGKPHWVQDDAFDIDRHVFRTQLPDPGGWKELRALMAWEFSRLLERDRPLWEVLLVEDLHLEGFPDGCVALISKVHHAAIDGVSGSEMMSALYDIQPKTPPPYAPPRVEGTAAPSGRDLLSHSVKNLQQTPKSLTRSLMGAARGLVKSGMTLGKERLMPPPLPFTAPRTRFNVKVTSQRSWSAALLPMEKIKALRRQVEGATVNDVVLTVCAGALRRLLLDQDELPKKPLVAMVPISVREQSEKGTMGNKVSAMLVSLATDLASPAERLQAVHDNARHSKHMHQAVGARNLSDASEFIPFSLAGLGTRLYTRLQMAEMHRPVFNLVITNVPGPRVPLFVGQAPLLAHLGAAPVFDGLGLILPIFSYADTLAVGITACHSVLPDAEVLAEHLRTSLDELLALE